MQKYVEAFLDDYNLITVKIYRSFFNGHSDVFYLSDNDSLVSLNVVRKEEFYDCIVYQFYTTYDFSVGKQYQIVITNGKRCPLQYRFIVKSEKFNSQFFYEGNDLGATVKNKITYFKLWAPTASEANVRINECYYPMKRMEKGVFSLEFNKDLSGCRYQYLIKVNGSYNLINDPYAKASVANSSSSVVVKEKNYFKKEIVLNNDYTDNIIYEASVRDFTAEGTFSALGNKISYLKNLGITHLQLLPVNDFASVDDYNRDVFYNWGYDPCQYQVLEGSYSSDPLNPEKVNDDFASLVYKLHNNSIALNIDVVFNHHYDAAESCFEKAVPYYYFRYNGEKYYEGTGCGNEFDTQQPMCRSFFLDTLKYYVNQFDVDGFRFDLMGFIDIETMQLFDRELRKIKPAIMLYGEGWKIPAGISEDLLTQYDKSSQVENIAFFNDHFRDVIKGALFNRGEKGYCSGNWQLKDEAVKAIRAQRFSSRQQSINYVECHDNMTCFDKLKVSCPEKSIEEIKEIQKLITAVTVLSQGVPFIHSGQELYASHNGLDNTYNGPASINNIENKTDDLSLYNYLKDLIFIRKKYHLNKENNDDIEISEDGSIIIYKINNCCNKQLTVIINPTDYIYRYATDKKAELILDAKGLQLEAINESFDVSPRSLSVLKEG